ncbi:hypothetical protein [Nesterenkonia sp. F]|uniref:hypothetical protein n=1 Tax=Nesterenkonia sp. F TaxID=795955 RepID=UPI000255D294|nr:hypothetical protein [Nesterenkonia sp. F]
MVDALVSGSVPWDLQRRAGGTMRGMTFNPCSDLTAAEWITASDEPWWSLVTLGPPGFPAYARLRFIPDPAYEGQPENDVVPQGDDLPEIDQLRVAVETLLPHTDSSAEGYLMMWDGWGEDAFPDAIVRTARVVVPNREYYVCKVSLPDFVSGVVEASWEARTGGDMPPPAFIWPVDRSWCITQDVDPHWAGIGAEQAAITSLSAQLHLDVVQVEPDQKLPFYY